MMSDPKIDPERMKKWEANTLPVPSAERLKGKGSSPSACSTHVLFKVRWSISGFCSTEPIAAFTTRKLANAEARRKNDAAIQCDYVVKTLKIIR